MKLSHFCIERPVFASVLSILIVLIGGFAYLTLPVAQYPEIAPPTVVVNATYPGANAETVADTVATPLEQEINGVENMLYMQSQATGDGSLQIRVTFALGTDLDDAQVLVQNRVAVAEARLPEEVRRLGVTVTKSSPDMLMVIHVTSPDGSRDDLYLSNYARLQIRDVLARIDGVGEVQVFGARDYSMRIWLDPDRMAARGLTAGDVVAALRAQNVQVASGVLNEPPVPRSAAYELSVETQGRLDEVREFERIAVRTDEEGRITRLDDVARVEIGALDYSQIGYLDGSQAVPLLIFQRPGSNALETAESLQQTMATLAADFPEGVGYDIIYNPTEFIAESIDEVIKTIFEAVALVIVVVILFLQTWRASIVPILAIPISLVGTFAVLAALGYSLNNLSLFGLVLAIGIVVDDAIVVVENVERHLRAGLSPREAAHKTMDEVSGALIAIALVLSAVFIPAAFVSGISGQFFRQFAVTIAAATAISALVSLTLSPALCGLLFKPHEHAPSRGSVLFRPVHAFFRGFDRGFGRLSSGYGRLTGRLIRLPLLVHPVYLGLIVLTGWQLDRTPTGFIPEQDQGYLITVIQLPPGASLERTDAVVREASAILETIPGITHTVSFAGFDGATFTNASNAGAIFSGLAPFEERVPEGLSADRILGETYARLGGIQEAFILTITPPPVSGIGNSGGFKMMIQDREGRGLPALEAAANELVAAANADPTVVGGFTLFNTRTPRVYADLDRVRAEMLGVPAQRLFETLEVYLGSAYINDFNFLGRTFRVTAQADGGFRQEVDDIADLRTRNVHGEMVPIGAIANFHDTTGPHRVSRFNLYPAAEVQGAAAPRVSSGDTLLAMEELAEQILPSGFGYAWTELAYQERQAGDSTLVVFGLSVVFVFLLLAAQYESWSLPLAVVLIVPMCLLAGVTGLIIRGLPIDILAQVGFIVLVGLAAKNAILIVEFARQGEEEGRDRFTAAVEAARTRLRPILMTSFAFILGVVPLVLASGAGAEMRISLGTAVFFGMIGVTLFGLIFTPVFYTAVRGVVGRMRRGRAAAPAGVAAE
ncbi:MAG TPA: multidrug efflux RND transporter permease subunit [Alphaproteobacteria bacterium]|nr:multidrug efflux RND transporter permease subunit [Alphaproteobacteria bacterium]